MKTKLHNIIKRIRKDRKRSFAISLLVILVLSFTVAVFLNLPEKVEAAWWDDSFGYRHRVSFTHNADLSTSQAVTFTLDTAELIAASLMQSDCDDTRFTTINGEPLSYDLTGTCDNATTTYEVIFPTIVNGSNVFFVYYGNPSVANNEIDSTGITALTPSGGDPSLTNPTSSGNQEKSEGPVAYWSFDEGYGTTTQDSSSNNNDGTISGATWQTEDLCFSGKCLLFDGSDDDIGTTNEDLISSAGTVSAWVYATAYGVSGEAYIHIIASQETVGGNSDFKIQLGDATDAGKDNLVVDRRLNGVDTASVSTTNLSLNTWYHVVGTWDGTTQRLYINGNLEDSDAANSAIPSDDTGPYKIGELGSDTIRNWQGKMDDVKIYNYARSAAQIKADYNAKNSAFEGSSVVLGANTKNLKSLSDGLVGYWKMDEASGTGVTDSSGNGSTGTAESGATVTSGKFGNSRSFNNTTSGRVSMGNASVLNFSATQSFTLSAWITMTDTSDGPYAIMSKKCCGGSAGYSLQLWQRKPTLWIQDGSANESLLTTSQQLNTGTWYHITAVLDRQNANNSRMYINGEIAPLETTNNQNNVGSLSNSENFGLGMVQPGGGNYYPYYGNIEETRVYNRALSSAEVSQLYNWAPGPVGYWRFEEKTGNTAYDESGNEKVGTLTNSPTWESGKFGGSVGLSGSEDYVHTNLSMNNEISGVGGGYTVNAWINPTASGEQGGRAMSFATNASDSNYSNGNALAIPSNNVIRWLLDYSGGDVTLNATAPTSLLNRWSYISARAEKISATETTYNIYINGVLLASATYTHTYSGTGTYRFGVIFTSYSQYGGYSGKIDDVKIYNYPRTQKQIIEDMNGGHPVGGSPVGSQVAYWKLDEGYGTTANDSTSNLNNLTLSTATSAWTNNGKFGKAWDGNGARYMSRGDDPDFDFTATEDFSVSLWYKSDGAGNPGSTEYLINKANATTAGWAIYANTSGNLCFAIDDDSSWTPDVASCTSTDVYDATWHHVVGIRNTALDTIAIFVDGIQRDSDSDTTSATLANGLSLYVGDRDGTDNGDEFTGDLDEIKVYRSALSADEIKIDYNRNQAQVLGALGNNSNYASGAANQQYCVPGDSTSCAAPVAEWRLEEKAGTLANDTSGSGYNNTIVGATRTQGKVGSGLKFNGTDQSMYSTGLNIDLSGTSAVTLSFWMSWDEFSDNDDLAVEFSQNSNGNAGTFKVNPNGSGTGSKFHVAISCNAGINSAEFTRPSAGVWHYYEIIMDQTQAAADEVTVYVDGVRQSITKLFSDNCTGSYKSESIFFMQRFNPSGLFGAGKLDEIRLYDYARTPAQIAWDYNQGAPLAHWKLDECQGSVANDSSGNGFVGTITPGDSSGDNDTVGSCNSGVTTEMWDDGTTGKRNASLGFDGTNDYVTIPDSPALNVTTFSVGAWVYPTALCAGTQEIITKQLSNGGFENNFEVRMDSCGGSFRLVDVNANNPVVSSVGAEQDEWIHVFATWDGTTAKIYIDGILSGSGTGQTFNTTTEPVRIGRSGDDAGYFSGQIDDVRIYNYALTSTQIKDIYNNGAVNFGPNEGTP